MAQTDNNNTSEQNWSSTTEVLVATSTQESIVTCLAFITDEYTTRMSQVVDAKWFAEPYCDIVALCLKYWHNYGKAPGKTHIDDHFAHILDNPDHKDNRAYFRLLRGMMIISEGINTAYVFSRLDQFAVKQNYKMATMDGGRVIADSGDFIDAREFDKIEEIWTKATQFRKQFTIRPKLCLSVQDWMDLEVIPSRKLLGSFLTTRSRTLIAGATGIGKSLCFGMELALNIANGNGFLHWPGSGQKARIMVIDAEMNQEDIKERMANALYRIGTWPDTFALISQDQSGGGIPPLNHIDGKRFLLQRIEEFRPDAIIYDNLDTLLEYDDKYGAKSISEAAPLFQLITSRSIAQLFLHHANGEDFYGSKKQGWQMMNIGIMQKPKDQIDVKGRLAFSLHFTKNRNRSVANWSDFEDVDIVFENQRWTSTPSKAKSSENPDTPKQKSTRKSSGTTNRTKSETKSATVKSENPDIPTATTETNAPDAAALTTGTATAEIIPIREKETLAINDLAFWCHKYLVDLIEESCEPEVSEQDWKQDCFRQELLGEKPEDRREQGNQHSRFAKVKAKLVKDGLVICANGKVWVTSQP